MVQTWNGGHVERPSAKPDEANEQADKLHAVSCVARIDMRRSRHNRIVSRSAFTVGLRPGAGGDPFYSASRQLHSARPRVRRGPTPR